jgi:hypothetical protein
MPSLQSLKAELIRARLSSDDVREAEEYLDKLTSFPDAVTKRSLLTSAIVAYARPFTNNGSTQDATSTLGVNPKKLLTADEHELHQRLLSLRNEVVAHTEFDRKPVQRLSGSATGFTMTGRVFDLLNQPIDLALFRKMCEVLQGYCFSKMMELNAQIVELENSQLPP